jgi:lysophospholipase L1-like esterase
MAAPDPASSRSDHVSAMRPFIVALALWACGGAPRARSEPQREVTIVVLGSSTAAGAGLSDPSTSWVNRYAVFLSTHAAGTRLVNLAVSGYSTFQVQPTATASPPGRPAVDPAHNITAALALHPDAIIVNLPSNDAAMDVPVDASIANIAVIAEQARQAHVMLWVTTSQPRRLRPDQVALLVAYRDRIAQTYGPRALDFFTPLAGPDALPLPALIQDDGIHPNVEGHRLLFEQVRAADLPAAIAHRATSHAPEL